MRTIDQFSYGNDVDLGNQIGVEIVISRNASTRSFFLHCGAVWELRSAAEPPCYDFSSLLRGARLDFADLPKVRGFFADVRDVKDAGT